MARRRTFKAMVAAYRQLQALLSAPELERTGLNTWRMRVASDSAPVPRTAPVPCTEYECVIVETQPDMSIVGKVNMIARRPYPVAINVGDLRIEPDGHITTFPGVPIATVNRVNKEFGVH